MKVKKYGIFEKFRIFSNKNYGWCSQKGFLRAGVNLLSQKILQNFLKIAFFLRTVNKNLQLGCQNWILRVQRIILSICFVNFEFDAARIG